MTTKCHNHKLWSRGQGMVEFAFSVTAFLMLVFCTINSARVVYARNFVSYAAREGSRYAAVHGAVAVKPASADDIKNLVKAEVHGLDPSGVVVTTTWTPDNKPGSLVKVQVKYTWNLTTVFYNFAPLTLSSTSQMVIDN